jgi:hypothetical protein
MRQAGACPRSEGRVCSALALRARCKINRAQCGERSAAVATGGHLQAEMLLPRNVLRSVNSFAEKFHNVCDNSGGIVCRSRRICVLRLDKHCSLRLLAECCAVLIRSTTCVRRHGLGKNE